MGTDPPGAPTWSTGAAERYGVRPEVRRRLDALTPRGVVLLVGSHARGEASPTSDLDVAVLCDRPPRREPGVFGYVSILGDSVVVDNAGGPVLNVEFIRRDLVALLRDLLAAVPGPADRPSLANLGPLELRTIERAGCGVVLRHDRADEDVLAGVDVVKARANTAALAFVLCVGHLRAAEAEDVDPAMRAIRLREAMVELLISEVNALGTLTFDPKHLVRRADRLVTGEPAKVLALLRDPVAAPRAAASTVRSAAREVLARIEHDRRRRLINTLLRPRLAAVAEGLAEGPDPH